MAENNVPLAPMTVQEVKALSIRQLGDKERRLMDMVESGDYYEIKEYLKRTELDINARDYHGRSVLQIAVTNQYKEIVEILLQVPGIRMGDALHFAAKEGNDYIVEMLLEWQDSQKSISDEPYMSAEFAPHLTPLMVACHENHYTTVRLFVQRGQTVKPPTKEDYENSKYAEYGETLELSLARIDAYRAMTSPSYIALSSEDPILDAFILSHEAQKLKENDPIFQNAYEELGQQCRDLAVGLLNECRTSEEVYYLLAQTHDAELTGMAPDPDYPRLQLALDFEQKEFITHPHCQQVLQNIWTAHHPEILLMSPLMTLLYFIPRILLLPFVYIGYFFLPWLKFWRPWKAPMNKFVGQTFSFLTFIVLVIVSMSTGQYDKRAPDIRGLDICIYVWVAAYIWMQMKRTWFGGIKLYVKYWWNIYDGLMLLIFVVSFVARFTSWVRAINDRAYREVERRFWPWDDPMLVSEAFYCAASVMAIGRVIYLFQLSRILGPMQLSLARMMYDVMQMLLLFFLTMFAFSFGMHRMYRYYDGMRSYDPSTGRQTASQNDAYSTWDQSFSTFFWNLYGHGGPESADVVMDNRYNATYILPENKHHFTEVAGYILNGMFHLITVTTLLNMLIAMMSNTLTHVQENADTEWKFARSRLWMEFFSHGGTLPPPLNVIPSPKSIFRLFLWMKLKICGGSPSQGEPKCSMDRCYYIETDDDKRDQAEFKRESKSVLVRLMERYLYTSEQEAGEEEKVTPDSLEQMKADLLREMNKLSSASKL